MDYVEMTKQFMKCDDEKRKEVFLAFVKKYYYDDMVVLNRETLEKIMPIISTPYEDGDRLYSSCRIFGTPYYKSICEYMAEEYCIEFDNQQENDYSIEVWYYDREDEIEFENCERLPVLFIKEFWDFYSNYVNG